MAVQLESCPYISNTRLRFVITIATNVCCLYVWVGGGVDKKGETVDLSEN